MNESLKRIGLGQWKVCWLPQTSSKLKGRILPERLSIEIYNANKDDAWDTFIHEIIEIKVRSTLRSYMILVNKLIEGYQEIVDAEKDQFIESLIEVCKQLQIHDMNRRRAFSS